MRHSNICESGAKILFAFIMMMVAMPADSHIQKPTNAAIVQVSTAPSTAIFSSERHAATRYFVSTAGEKNSSFDSDGQRHRDYFRNLTECSFSCDLCTSCCTCFTGLSDNFSLLTSYDAPFKREKRRYCDDIEGFLPHCDNVRIAACY